MTEERIPIFTLFRRYPGTVGLLAALLLLSVLTAVVTSAEAHTNSSRIDALERQDETVVAELSSIIAYVNATSSQSSGLTAAFVRVIVAECETIVDVDVRLGGQRRETDPCTLNLPQPVTIPTPQPLPSR